MPRTTRGKIEREREREIEKERKREIQRERERERERDREKSRCWSHKKAVTCCTPEIAENKLSCCNTLKQNHKIHLHPNVLPRSKYRYPFEDRGQAALGHVRYTWIGDYPNDKYDECC
jgi:hypothetical protein